jgi:chromosome segregation ATPase
MDAPSDPKLNPAVALLKELDNLLAQLRSIEPELKRAQAAADEKVAHLQEQVTELQRVRHSNEDEIGALRYETKLQQRALTERQEAVTAVELALHGKIQLLQQDLARLRNELQERDGKAEAEQRLGAKVEELQLQLADRQLLVESRAAEIADLKAQLAGSRRPKQTEIDDAASANATERKPMNDDTNKTIAQSAGPFEQSGSAQQRSGQTLQDEIDRLRREVQERNQILQDRNDELVRFKAEYDRLSERVSDLESAAMRSERAYSGEAERERTEFQAQVALLQAELSQKEWALEEHQAEARGREQSLLDEIGSLRRQLAEGKTGKPNEPDDFVFGEPRVNSTREQPFELAGHASADQGHNGFASHRRWHTGFGWKRRWRS